MCSLEKRIRDLIHFYVKENYNHHLQKNELTFIKEEDIPSVVDSEDAVYHSLYNQYTISDIFLKNKLSA